MTDSPRGDTFKVGFTEDRIADHSRQSWSGDAPRPIKWAAWYPADHAAIEEMIGLPPDEPLFVMGNLARNAPLTTERDRFPVVLLSHGTGGTATSLGWLARRLAASGLIVIGVDHHGNTASEAYRPEGFLCWWERPRDLTFALDHLSKTSPFAGRLDLDRIFAAGFSLGSHTVLSLAGAITDMNLFQAWARKHSSSKGPREFPDLADHIPRLFETSSVFRSSWERQSIPYLDKRVKAVLALAPAPPVRGLTPESLKSIHVPVAIAVGDADLEAPPRPCAEWLHGILANSSLTMLGFAVGHYTLLSEGTDAGRRVEPAIWADPNGVDRRKVHNHVAALALCCFELRKLEGAATGRRG
jgi:predicted dienelactone hydrolase